MKDNQTINVYADKLSVRSVITEDGEKYYCLADVGKCLGYKAPEKFSLRFADDKKKFLVRWISGRRTGKVNTYCATAKSILSADAGISVPHSFKKWLIEIDKDGREPAEIIKNKEEKDDCFSLIECDDDRNLREMVDKIMSSLYEIQKELEKRKWKKEFLITMR